MDVLGESSVASKVPQFIIGLLIQAMNEWVHHFYKAANVSTVGFLPTYLDGTECYGDVTTN